MNFMKNYLVFSPEIGLYRRIMQDLFQIVAATERTSHAL